MTFHSILFAKPEDCATGESSEAPAFFVDLNLDQVVEAITAGRQEYDLKPFFYAPLHDIDAIRYRQEIMQELENKALYNGITQFADNMRVMRQQLAQAEKLRYKYQKERWFLDAVATYCHTVVQLAHDLTALDLHARGFVAFRAQLTDYVRADRFTALQAETEGLLADLAGVRYCLLIKNNSIQVRKYDCETDYSAEVAATFERFRQGNVRDRLVEFPSWPEMNHVEEQILGLVARLHPDIFSHLDAYYSQNSAYLDEAISVFDREIQFYIAYLEYIAPLKRAGLRFCYPQLSDTDKAIHLYDGFDLALATKLVAESSPVVCNDFYLAGDERVFVVSGPNQGGKTTFARAFGQLHYLASIGCPVPGRDARLFLYDRLLTHFEKEEDVTNLQGKLQDDLLRIYEILAQATPNSIIIINEIFTSTALQDAIFLSKEVMARILALDALCVCVTFIDELAALSPKTVSVVSTVMPENPSLRTYKIVRRPADGLAYALSIAEKHRVTYRALKERIAA